MFDLGDTLVRNDAVLPNVPEALATIRDFETADGHPLERCLVSDFSMPSPPVTPAKTKKLFQKYLALVDQFNLKKLFEPVERRITLSTQAGVLKPNRKIFELAVRRLGIDARLSECLFITENAEHIAKCKLFGMSTLQFGPESSGGDFDDWSEGPLLISQRVTPDGHNNLELGVRLHLATNYGMELISMKKKQAGRGVRGQAQKWHPVPDPKSGGKEKIDVSIPVDVDVDLTKKGRIRSVKTGQPDSEAVKDAQGFLESLEANKQVTDKPGQLPPGATHRIETDKKGRKRLVRKRFSAI
jgi:hypothetical protein